jgi:hypothetical protein
MNKHEIFAAWAPDSSLWSPWTKPVLFAYLDTLAATSELSATPANLDWCPPAKDKVVVVADLPGAESVLMGVALAERGYRPVPLYNAVPLPSGQPILDPATGLKVAAVDVLPIISALRSGAERLANLQISTEAPPVFLLDDNRQADGRKMMEDEFDNRSVCFTTDFPSANFLLGHGFQRALLVQKSALNVRSDLAHVLRRWQEGGIALELVRTEFPARPQRLDVPRPSWYGAMFQRALMALGLGRATGGGFGAWMPESSAGG